MAMKINLRTTGNMIIQPILKPLGNQLPDFLNT
jgi:hypothetical protein